MGNFLDLIDRALGLSFLVCLLGAWGKFTQNEKKFLKGNMIVKAKEFCEHYRI